MSFLVNWNELFLSCVASGNLGPTVTARAMQTAHTAIYDTWAAFDPTAVGVHSRLEATETLLAADTIDDALEEAIAYASYVAAIAIFPAHAEVIRAFMEDLGFDPDADTSDLSTAAGLGAAAAQAVLKFRASDFSNAAGNFADTTGYAAVNSANPDAPNAPGGPDFDPNSWQPLRVPTGAVLDDNGNPVITDDPASFRDQRPLTPQMGEVKSFGLRANDQFRPPAPPQLGDDSEYIDGTGTITTNDQAYRDQFGEVLEISGSLTAEQKAIAEFWADGPRSETPPGHWNQLAQDVSARDNNSLAEDVVMFFALNNALLDASDRDLGVEILLRRHSSAICNPQSLFRSGSSRLGRPQPGVRHYPRSGMDALPAGDIRNAAIPRIHLRSQRLFGGRRKHPDDLHRFGCVL